MTLSALVDNDVLIKGSAYGVLDLLPTIFGERLGVLGAARFVVGKRIDRHPGLLDRERAREHWETFLASAHELEPSDAELALSTALEEAASRSSLSLDAGESQLCAVGIVRSVEAFLTGDKRAVAAIEQLVPIVTPLAQLCGRVIILEQLCQLLLAVLDTDRLRTQVCREPNVDIALTICFHCSGRFREQDISDALESYVSDVRRAAVSALYPGLDGRGTMKKDGEGFDEVGN